MNESSIDKVVGWIGSASGIIGALLLAMNFKYSGYGYVFFLVSSMVLAVWAYRSGAKHNFTMQICFLAMNSLGVYNWLLK